MNGTPQPAPRGPGCCGFGCAALFALVIFFAVAFLAGGYWALRHYGNQYTSAQPVTLPETFTSDEPDAIEPAPPFGAPSPAPGTPARSRAKEVETRYEAFEEAAKHNEEAAIALSAGDINTLLQNNKNTRGRVSVSIDNNVARVRFSYPIKDIPLMKGRYLNGEATGRASPDGDPAKAQISDIILANKDVPDGMVDQRFFGWPSLRQLATDWLSEQNIESFRIENNRVLGETRGIR